MKFNILIGMLCFLLSSCLIGEDNNSGTNAPGQVDVTFSVTLPQPETVTTRAGMPYSDTDIKTVDVLVFDQFGRFMNRIQVDEPDLVSTGSGAKFSIRLDATSDRRIIHLVANGRMPGLADRVNFQDMPMGALENQILPSLQTRVTNQGSGLLTDIMPLVMWGRTDLNEVSVVSSASIKLLRVAASVNVKTANVTMENGLYDFTIKKIALIGAVGGGYLTPDNGFYDVVTPNQPRPLTGGFIWGVEQTWSDEGMLTVYTYECGYSAPNYQGVILSAVYNGQAGFYKVALVNENGTPLNIVRNHRYTLTVTKVSGPGYADINTAIASAPSNAIKVSLTDDDEDFPCLVADGQHMMGMSNNSMMMYGIPTEDVILGTVYSSRGISPVVSVIDHCDWLTNLRVTALGDDKFAISGRFVNGGQSSLYATLNLACDNLVQTMEVSYFPQVSSLRDGDSYLIILTSRNKDLTWNVGIVEGESDFQKMTLSATHSNPSYFPGIAYNSSLNSKYAPEANLHVAMGVRGVVKMNEGASWNGTAVVSRVVVRTP